MTLRTTTALPGAITWCISYASYFTLRIRTQRYQWADSQVSLLINLFKFYCQAHFWILNFQKIKISSIRLNVIMEKQHRVFSEKFSQCITQNGIISSVTFGLIFTFSASVKLASLMVTCYFWEISWCHLENLKNQLSDYHNFIQFYQSWKIRALTSAFCGKCSQAVTFTCSPTRIIRVTCKSENL